MNVAKSLVSGWLFADFKRGGCYVIKNEGILDNKTSLNQDKHDLILNRERLNEMLIKALQYPIVLVTAPAGFGKSQAVASALNKADVNVIWLPLTKLDNIQARIWKRFVSALEPNDIDLYNYFVNMGYPSTPASYHKSISMMEKTFKNSSKQYVLFLDDYQLLTENNVLNFFQAIAFAGIPNFTTVIVSRVIPDFGVSILAAKNILKHISEKDLLFTKEETSDYFKLNGIELSGDEEIEKIYSYTGGWVIAIVLIALAIQQGSFYLSNTLSNVVLDIYELIEKEIYSRTSENLQIFLAKLSLLPNIPYDLLIFLADNDGNLLYELNHLRMMSQYDASTETFQLHTIFKEFLLRKSEEIDKQHVKDLYFNVAKWYDNKGNDIAAVNYFMESGSYPDVLRIIVRVKQDITPAVSESFIEVLDGAPKELLEKMPQALIVKANHLFVLNRIDEAQIILLGLQAQFEALPRTEANIEILGEIYCTLGLISIVKQTYDFQEYFKMSFLFLRGGSKLMFPDINIAEGLNLCGIKSSGAGEAQLYEKAIFDSAYYMVKVLNGNGYGMEYLVAADFALMRGDMKNAEKNSYKAIFMSQEKGQYEIELVCYFYLLRIYLSRGDVGKIQEILLNMENRCEQLQQPFGFYIKDITDGWFYNKIGQNDKVPPWIMSSDKVKEMLALVVLGRECLVRTNCYLEQERYTEMLAYIDTKEQSYNMRGLLYAIIQNRICEAIAHHYLKNYKESIDALNKAYELSSPNDLVVQYTEYGNKMRTILRAALKSPDCNIPKEWLEKMYTKSNTYGKMLSKVSTEFGKIYQTDKSEKALLSKREREVLEYLCRGLTRDEIAEECGLSANTIKSVLQSVFNKLGASNSHDAVHIATRMQLIEYMDN